MLLRGLESAPYGGVDAISIGASTNGGTKILSTTLAFRITFGVILSLIAAAQLLVGIAFLRNRRNSLLELSQPHALALLAFTGSLSTAGSCLLALPHDHLACALLQPILLSCVTLSGSIIASRAWRIASIVAPPALVRAEQERDKAARVRAKVMAILTSISGQLKWTLIRRKGRANTTSIRRQVTFADFIKIVVVLTSPQLILQIICVSISSIRVQSNVIDYQGISVYTCSSDAGIWPLIVGIVLALIPIFLALLINLSSQGMPDIFREYEEIFQSMKIGLGILVITVPALAMAAVPTPNVQSYLVCASLLSIVLPLNWYVAWIKLYTVTWRANKAKLDRKTAVARQKRPSYSSSEKRTDDMETIKLAEDALTMGNALASMGRSEKALEAYQGALSMFKSDDEFSVEAGFNKSEVLNFGPKDLHIIASVLITSAKLAGTEGDREKSDKFCLEAMRVVDNAPAKQLLKDRSVLFQVFSYMAVSIKGGMKPPGDQSNADFESSYISKYVTETLHSTYHHCRSLALRAEFLAKNNQFDSAIEALEHMNALYDPVVHSKAIGQDYGSDQCANTISLSSLWLLYLHRTDDALETSNYVVERILPYVDKGNMLGLTLLLIPVVLVFKFHGEARRAWKLYNDHIAKTFAREAKSAGKPLVRPVITLLALAADDHTTEDDHEQILEKDIAWILDGTEKVSDWSDNICTHLGFSIYSILAEVCLRLAKRCDDAVKKTLLITEGLRLAKLCQQKTMGDEGTVLLPIPHMLHEPIAQDLERFKFNEAE